MSHRWAMTLGGRNSTENSVKYAKSAGVEQIMTKLYLLDANAFKPIIKGSREDPAAHRFYAELKQNSIFYLCPVSLCEVLVLLYRRQASAQQKRFDELLQYFHYVEFIRQDWEETAQMRAELLNLRKEIEIPDILIAVQAKRLRATVVTENETHFKELNIPYENWSQS